VRDLWNHADMPSAGDQYSGTVAPHRVTLPQNHRHKRVIQHYRRTAPIMNIRGIAKMAGVSTATERKERKVIEGSGYHPNRHDRLLSSGKSNTYGLIISDHQPIFP